MLHERIWKALDGSLVRRVEEQLELMAWETVSDRCWRRVLREWPPSGGRVPAHQEMSALSARPRATYEDSAESGGALATAGLSW